jgi:hypothetical protein
MAADNAQIELDKAIAANQPLILEKEKAIQNIENQVGAEIAALQRSRFNGLAARMEALARLTSKSEAILLASLFITLLFIAIETAPIMVKLISYRSPYDFILHEHEHVFEMANLEKTTLLTNSVKNKLRFDTETGAYIMNAKIAAEKAMIDQKLKEKLEELKNKPFDWKLGSFEEK